MHFNAGAVVILASVIFPVTLVVTYTISLYNRHILPVWPYISHTGNDPDESCFFSLGLNIVAGLYALIAFLRYAQLLEYLKQEPKQSLTHLNRSSLAWGMISSLTLSSTASFQQRNFALIHVLSAVACSYSALIYFWHQTVFSFTCCRWSRKPIRRFRMVLSISSTVIHCFAPCLYLYCLVSHPLPKKKVTEWTNDTEEMALYVTGSFMEWFVFIFNVLYIGSLYTEFTRIRIKIGEIIIDHQRLVECGGNTPC